MALFWRKIGDKVSGVFLALQIIEVQESSLDSYTCPDKKGQNLEEILHPKIILNRCNFLGKGTVCL